MQVLALFAKPLEKIKRKPAHRLLVLEIAKGNHDLRPRLLAVSQVFADAREIGLELKPIPTAKTAMVRLKTKSTSQG